MKASALLVLLLTALAIPAQADGAIRTLTASHTYTMGDNQSKDEARAFCYQEVKRKVQEQAGVFVRSLTRTSEYELAEDTIESFSAAVLRMEEVEESVAMVGETLAITMNLSALVDTDEVDRLLAEYAAQAPPLAPQATESQPAPYTPGNPAARTRTMDPQAMTRLAASEVVKSMPEESVLSLLGEPWASRSTGEYQCSRYGDLWVVYKDNAVQCSRILLQQVDRLGGDCHCDGLSQTFVMR